MDSLQAIANGVKERQRKTLTKKALEGNTRAIELRWMQEVQDVHNFRPSVFTDRERGFISDLIERLGTEETIKLIVWSVKTWKSHLTYVSLYGIPPLPIFEFFYFRRNIFLALMKDSEQRQGKFEKDHRETLQKREEQEKERPKISLTELFEKAKLEIKEGKASRWEK